MFFILNDGTYRHTHIKAHEPMPPSFSFFFLLWCFFSLTLSLCSTVLALYTYVCACYSNDEGMRNYSNSIKKKRRERGREREKCNTLLSIVITH